MDPMDPVRCSGRRQYDDANWSPIATNHLYLWYQHGMLGQRLLEIRWNMLELNSPHDRRSKTFTGPTSFETPIPWIYCQLQRAAQRETASMVSAHQLLSIVEGCVCCVLMITSARVTPVHIVSWDVTPWYSCMMLLWDQRLYSLHRLIDTARRRWLYETRLKANLGHL